MLKKILMILVLMLVFSNGAFACCAFCNMSGWDLLLMPFQLLWLLLEPYYLFLIGIFLIYLTLFLSVFLSKRS